MIFYFSGTGNTQWAARQLAEATGERLLFIPQELITSCEYTLDDHERIGFCFPVHGWQPPRIVRQFIEKLNISNAAGHYCYALCTCGDQTGLSMNMLEKALVTKGLSLQSVCSLVMPESYVCLPFMYTDTPEREQEKIEQAGKDLEEFINVVRERKDGFRALKLGPWPWVLSHVVGAYFNRYMITDKKFTVDADCCLHCGKCAQVCPTGDLTFDGKVPSWKNDSSCTCCLSCYHHCPAHAINYGKITRKRGQYYFGHH